MMSYECTQCGDGHVRIRFAEYVEWRWQLGWPPLYRVVAEYPVCTPCYEDMGVDEKNVSAWKRARLEIERTYDR